MKGIHEEIQKWNAFRDKKKEGVRPFVLRKEMKKIMDRYLGPNRNANGMEKAIQMMLDLRKNGVPRMEVAGAGNFFNTDWRSAVETEKSIELSELVIRSALFRKETRGHHFRSDYPKALETPQHTLITRKGDAVEVAARPVKTLG